jgi:hypothetical protein
MVLLADRSPLVVLFGIIGFILFPWLIMSVIGYIYYYARGPRIAFRQIMTKRWVVVSSGFLVGLGFLSQVGKVISMVVSKGS